MEENSLIILEDGKRCELLSKVTYNNVNYFLAEQVNENDKPIENYAILKETKENNDYYVEKEENKEILLEVLQLITQKFAKVVGDLKVEDLL